MQLMNYFPVGIKGELAGIDWSTAEEIRIRIGQPVEILLNGGWYLGQKPFEKDMLYEMLNYLSGYSLFALEEEMRQGYFTIPGGHRVGLCGHVSFHEKEGRSEADFLSEISGMNIRIAHERKGCAKALIPYIRKGDSIYHTFLFAPPGMGKTTYLRDCIRLLSEGSKKEPGFKVGVVDERSEIGASHLGIVQNDLGPRTDVMDNCPKEIGMQMILRSMSPEILAVDELGKKEDFFAVREAVNAGVKILGTIHAESKAELFEKPYMTEILQGREWRFVRINRTKNGMRQLIVYAQGEGAMEEGIWVNG